VPSRGTKIVSVTAITRIAGYVYIGVINYEFLAGLFISVLSRVVTKSKPERIDFTNDANLESIDSVECTRGIRDDIDAIRYLLIHTHASS